MQRTLEANLATINDSADLLRAEIAKEEALLAEEKQSLQEMERNAKRAETERKRQMKNVGAKALQDRWTPITVCFISDILSTGTSRLAPA
jgi:hypothetical protein